MARQDVQSPEMRRGIVSDEINWNRIRDLAQRVLERSEPLELSDDTRALLLKTAREVTISEQDAEDALRSVPTATTLLGEIRQRIREGSRRLSRARDRVEELQEKGDLNGAQQVIGDLLTVEVVPLYREQAEILLDELTGLAEVLATGRINPDLHDRQQLAVLVQRIQQGHPLEITDDLRALVRQTAPTAAITEAETEEALKSPEGAEALMGMILSRFRKAQSRFLRSMYRMTSLRDGGNVEEARQQMRDVLAVEVVPQYRRMAEEQLRGLDSPPPKS
jgi:DUSAM domain-containing protein